MPVPPGFLTLVNRSIPLINKFEENNNPTNNVYVRFNFASEITDNGLVLNWIRFSVKIKLENIPGHSQTCIFGNSGNSIILNNVSAFKYSHIVDVSEFLLTRCRARGLRKLTIRVFDLSRFSRRIDHLNKIKLLKDNTFPEIDFFICDNSKRKTYNLSDPDDYTVISKEIYRAQDESERISERSIASNKARNRANDIERIISYHRNLFYTLPNEEQLLDQGVSLARIRLEKRNRTAPKNVFYFEIDIQGASYMVACPNYNDNRLAIDSSVLETLSLDDFSNFATVEKYMEFSDTVPFNWIIYPVGALAQNFGGLARALPRLEREQNKRRRLEASEEDDIRAIENSKKRKTHGMSTREQKRKRKD